MSIDTVTENARTDGRTPRNDLMIFGHGDISVGGFTRSISYNIGETVQFCVDGGATTIDIYRTGWYGGDGFRLIASVTNTPTTQPEAQIIPDSNGATTCTNWGVTATWDIPTSAVSGMYLALVRSIPPNAPNVFWITFVVRDDAAQADILYKTSDSTWGAAYNHYGTKSNINGKNVYGSGTGVGNINDRSLCVSYHRPVITRSSVIQTYWNACELPMIRFLERNGYSVKYISSVDLDLQGKSILQSGKIFMSSGHDEYWSEPMRRAVEQWRDQDAGKSIFSSANEVFWKTRHEYIGDECRMWCYKDTMPGPTGYTRTAGSAFDPVSWTGTWKDTRWANREPENLLTGTDFRMNGVVDLTATVNPEFGTHPAWRNTQVATGSTLVLPEVIGFEADELQPAQESHAILAGTSINIDGRYADNNGQNYNGNGVLDWGIVSQGYESGGITLGFGTCQWGWALDGTHDRGSGATTVRTDAQQFTVNVLTDLGASANTIMDGLVASEPAGLSAYGGTDTQVVAPSAFSKGGGVFNIYLKSDTGLVELRGNVK